MFAAIVVDAWPSGIKKYPTILKVVGLYNTERGAKCAVTRRYPALRQDEKGGEWRTVPGCHTAGSMRPLQGWYKAGIGFVVEVKATASTVVPFNDFGVSRAYSQVGFWLDNAPLNAIPVRVPNWGTLWVGVF